ncbi:hypothetical protein [uncultured Adlercreutzia sp.]|nr:hypothetical protein [uncultured Adlercreutzia sp.]
MEFRRWATDVLRRYIIEDRAENEKGPVGSFLVLGQLCGRGSLGGDP